MMKDALLAVGWLAPDGIPRQLLPSKARKRLDTSDDGTLAVSPVLQKQLRDQHGERGRVAAITAMRSYFMKAAPDRIGRCLKLLPHVNAWMSLTTPADDFPEALDLLTSAVVLLLENQMGTAAVPLAERVVRSARLHLGQDDPRTLTVQANLASAYDKAGEPRRGARLLEKVIERRTALFGDDHPTVWGDYNNLGEIYLSAEEYDRAAELVERIIAYRLRTLDENHPDTLIAHSNLAAVLDKAGRTSEARALWVGLLPKFERYVGSDHPDTILVRRSLDRTRGEDGPEPQDLAEVEARIALLSRSQDTQALFAARVERATILRDHDRLDEAMAAFTEVMETGAAVLGRGHPLMVSVGYRLAYLHEKAGRIGPALATARESLVEADHNLGRTHEETLRTTAYLLYLLLADGRLEEHHALLEDRLADIIEGLGFANPLVRTLAVQRARLHLKL